MTRKTIFFEECSWFKFNNLGLARGIVTSVTRLKLRFWGLIPMFVEVTGKKLVGKGAFLPPILNRIKHDNCIVKLSLIPDSPIILTTLKNFTTGESF